MDDQLTETVKFQQAILDSTDYVIISTDIDGTILSFNKGAEKALEYNAEEVVNLKTLQIIHDINEMTEYAKQLSSELGTEIEPGSEVFVAKTKFFKQSDSREWTYISKGGRRFPVWLSITELKDFDDNLIGYLGIARDISKEKNREQEIRRRDKELKQKTLELERSNVELEQFAYVTSHDLQEPLRVISSFAELLDRRLLQLNNSDESVSRYIGYITQSISRMQDMIRAILAYSRVGRKTIYQKVNLDKILRTVLLDLSKSILEKKAEISFDTLPEMIVCEIEIRQLFQNLISNALKFMQPDVLPQINIAVKQINDNEWQFTVKDNGIGIDEEFYKRVFVIFQRLHTREEFEGTGIGLALCKKIVENHKGNIKVDSSSGEGTSFCFTIKNME